MAEEAQGYNNCKFSTVHNVSCATQSECKTCGWNPYNGVKEYRVEKTRKELNEKFLGGM